MFRLLVSLRGVVPEGKVSLRKGVPEREGALRWDLWWQGFPEREGATLALLFHHFSDKCKLWEKL